MPAERPTPGTAPSGAESPGPRSAGAAPTATRRAARPARTLALIALVTVAPFVAAYVAYYLFPRQAHVNYGTLRLPTRPFPDIAGSLADGAPFRIADLRGRWLLVAVAPRECDAACARNLYAGRQARTMQGKERERIARVLLVAGEMPPPALLDGHPELLVARVPEAGLAALGDPARGLLLVDPLGNLVLDYPPDPDIKGVAGDLTRLLKASRIG